MNRPPIIDIHCHAAGIGAGKSGCQVAAQLRRSWKFHIYLRAFGVTIAELEEHGDQLVLDRLAQQLATASSVDQAVILALDSVVDSSGRPHPEASEITIPNSFVLAGCRAHPNLLFGASVNPYRRDALDRLEEVVANGAVLLKWLPSIQMIDPADRSLIPFYRRLAQLRLPLLTHTGEEASFTRADKALGDPERLRPALEEGVLVIAAHSAGNGRNHGEHNFARFLRLAAEFPNLHADVSALTLLNRLGQLQMVIAQPQLHDRLHFGTDMPLPAIGLASPWFQLGRLPLAEIRRLAALRNPWDQSLQLKLALGLPVSSLANTARILRLS